MSEPTRIGPYRTVILLGRGGQASVYLAEDTRLPRRVALKVLHFGAAVDPVAFERFRREAEITSKLDHKGICPVYETGDDGGARWIAMRYVEGDSLARKIAAATSPPDDQFFVSGSDAASEPALSARPGRTPVSRADVVRTVILFEHAARALHAAHEHGVIHRDVKPANIMVDGDGEPVILDFGLAQETSGDQPTLSLTGDLAGTPPYMSPEQIGAKRIRLDRRTDVYSLGVCLYECLTLRRPFESPTREGLYQAIMTKEPPDPRGLNPAISSDLRIVIATAIEKDRDRRYQTAADFADDLRRVVAREPIVAKPVGHAVRLARWAQRNPALAAAVAGLFGILAIGLGVSLILLGQRNRALAEKATALDEVTTQRNAKEDALGEMTREKNEKADALSSYDRLVDHTRLRRLQAEADALWPAEPSRVPALKDWIEQGVAIAGRAKLHAAYLASLRESGRATSETRAESRITWLFRDDSDQFKHDSTAALVEELTAFDDPSPSKGLLANVRRRLSFAEFVARDTIEQHAAAWSTAIRSIADRGECPKYQGLRIDPQLGLIPIGRDRTSGLWEFSHLQTTSDGADPIPKRTVAGRLAVTDATGLVFVLLPGGSFRMGAEMPDEETAPTAPNVDRSADANESPVHEVTLAPFFLSKYEMTQGQWSRIVGRNPSTYGPGTTFAETMVDLRHPVEQVSWDDCDRWLGRLGLVVPTEAQWEYAARAGTTTPWWTGIDTEALAAAANLADQSLRRVGPPTWRYEKWNDGWTVHAPVGTFAPNGFGLHDVIGNVWEWCRDHHVDYRMAVMGADAFRRGSSGQSRVLRGGSFYDDAANSRVSLRFNGTPEAGGYSIGVRPAMRIAGATEASSRPAPR